MKFKVTIYLGDKLIKDEDIHKLVIRSDVIDRIVNSIVDRNKLGADDTIDENEAYSA